MFKNQNYKKKKNRKLFCNSTKIKKTKNLIKLKYKLVNTFIIFYIFQDMQLI